MSTATTTAMAYQDRKGILGTLGRDGLLQIILIANTIIMLAPIVIMVFSAFKTTPQIFQSPFGIPDFTQVSNFVKIWTQTNFLRYLLNSIWVSLASTVLGVAVAVPAAYAFSRFSFPGKNALFFSVLVRNMFPLVVFLIPLFILMRNLRLVDTHLSLIVTYLTFGLPLSIWLLKGFYDNIPPQLEQAARIDGATRFQAFWKIVMPLSSPGIIATAIYAFIQAWNEYVYALTFLNSDRLLTLPVGLQRFFAEYSTNWPGLMAASFIMSVPVVVLFLVLQKHFVRALTEGAVKT